MNVPPGSMHDLSFGVVNSLGGDLQLHWTAAECGHPTQLTCVDVLHDYTQTIEQHYLITMPPQGASGLILCRFFRIRKNLECLALPVG